MRIEIVTTKNYHFFSFADKTYRVANTLILHKLTQSFLLFALNKERALI